MCVLREVWNVLIGSLQGSMTTTCALPLYGRMRWCCFVSVAVFILRRHRARINLSNGIEVYHTSIEIM